MERKDRKFNYKIGGIVTIAIVAAVVGTLAFTSSQTNSDSQTQSIGIGAYVTVEAYHEDGTLFQKFEGHNLLTETSRNSLVACITGLDTTPIGFSSSCVGNVNKLLLRTVYQNNSTLRGEVTDAIVSPTPENCDFDDIANLCTGWTMKGTFDFDQLDCTDTVDCLTASQVSAKGVNSFNILDIDPIIFIVPNDRIAVTMNFTISE